MVKWVKEYGLEATQEVADLVNEQIYAMKHIVEAEKLDCEFELRRSYDVYLDESQSQDAHLAFQSSLDAEHVWTRDVDEIDPHFVEQVRTGVRKLVCYSL